MAAALAAAAVTTTATDLSSVQSATVASKLWQR